MTCLTEQRHYAWSIIRLDEVSWADEFNLIDKLIRIIQLALCARYLKMYRDSFVPLILYA